MTDETYIQEPVLSALKMSPDEAWAAVAVKRAILVENRYEWTLDLWNTQSWKKRWSEPLRDEKFWWLSETEWLKRDETGEWGIRRLLSPDGTGDTVETAVWEEKKLPLPEKITQIQVLPDGRWLLTVQESIPQDPDYYEAECLPFMEDGKGYIKSFGTLYLYEPRKKNVLRLLSDRYEVKQAGGGKEGIWFTGYKRDLNRVDFLHSAFYWIPFQTGQDAGREKENEPKVLIKDGEIRIDAVVEAEGGWLAAASSMKKHGPGQSPDFWFLTREGTLTLFAENDMSASHAVVRDWKKTGRQFEAVPNGLAYLATRRGEVQIYTCTAGAMGEKSSVSAGGKIRCLLREAGTIDAFHRFLDGRVLTVGAYEWNLDELYVYENSKRRQVSDYHRRIEAPKRSSFQMRDGAVDVTVLYPKGAEPLGSGGKERQYPAILTIHGGHKLAYGTDVLNLDFKLWTDEGYFVIYCNPRGSEGIDDSFADIIGKNGKADAEDILKALDQVLEREKRIDRSRIGITGGSYGGYLTNWLITQTNRFACAVSVRSISNRMSKELDSDTGFRYPLASLGNTVWEQSEEFWDASPLKYIANCTTPTLVVHAEGDRRCPVAEGIQMYTALKLRKVPAKLILFSGESHGLAVSGKPRARLKHSRVIREWFSEYLKEEKRG